MRKLLAWFRSHPIFAGCTVFLALCVCLHFFLNWKAERRWQTYATEARARGVKLNLTDFAPPKIPDEENFAALPMMRAMMKAGAKSPMALPTANPPSFGDPLKGERLDWQKWQSYFKDAGFISETTDSPPRDVLRALEHYAPQFQEWSEWRTRKQCRFDLDLNAGAAIPFPHLGLFANAAKLFSLRAQTQLALGNSVAAYDDFRNCLQAYFSLANEPALICGLVRITCLQTAIWTAGAGLADHSWDDENLQKIAEDFAAVRVWDGYKYSFASERGFGNGIEDKYIDKSPWERASEISAIPGLPGFSGPPIGYAFALLMPDRMFRDNQLRANRYFDELLGRVNAEGTKYDPDRATPSGADQFQGIDDVWFAFFKISAPVFSTVAEMFALVQTRLDQGTLAIAIERFEIKRGLPPKSLTELAPDFIARVPDDIYSAKPMIYRRKEGGGFVLYSVGPNLSDDGAAAFDKSKSAARQPDLVWPYP